MNSALVAFAVILDPRQMWRCRVMLLEARESCRDGSRGQPNPRENGAREGRPWTKRVFSADGASSRLGTDQVT